MPARDSFPNLRQGHLLTMGKLDAYCSMSTEQPDVYDLLRTARWKPLQGGSIGSSWIEFFVRFFHLGVQVIPKLDEDIIVKNPSLDNFSPALLPPPNRLSSPIWRQRIGIFSGLQGPSIVFYCNMASLVICPASLLSFASATTTPPNRITDLPT